MDSRGLVCNILKCYCYIKTMPTSMSLEIKTIFDRKTNNDFTNIKYIDIVQYHISLKYMLICPMIPKLCSIAIFLCSSKISFVFVILHMKSEYLINSSVDTIGAIILHFRCKCNRDIIFNITFFYIRHE